MSIINLNLFSVLFIIPSVRTISSDRLERLVYTEKAAGSNPASSTGIYTQKNSVFIRSFVRF